MARQAGTPGIDSAAEELHAGRDDPDEWAEEPAPVHVRPTTTSVVSFRLPHDELELLQTVARARGESISDFVRASIRKRIGGAAAIASDDSTDAGPPTRTPELEVVARIDGIDVTEVIHAALTAHVEARRRDPAFQTRLRQEQTLLNALVE